MWCSGHNNVSSLSGFVAPPPMMIERTDLHSPAGDNCKGAFENTYVKSDSPLFHLETMYICKSPSIALLDPYLGLNDVRVLSFHE